MVARWLPEGCPQVADEGFPKVARRLTDGCPIAARRKARTFDRGLYSVQVLMQPMCIDVLSEAG
eukprot:2382711-Alexandrium_andersonii.AAC.1